MHLVLLGYRASGKTTTGRALAAALGMRFVDLDELLSAKFDTTIADVFRRFGEAWFRAAECTELERVLAEPDAVIALGGGTPCSPASGELLRKARAAGKARTVYLRATVETLKARLLAADNAHRPTLTDAGHPADEVERVMCKRGPQYEGAADAVIDVDTLTPEQAAAMCVAKLVRPTGS